MMIISDEAEHGNSAQMHKILINWHTKTAQQMPQKYIFLLACLGKITTINYPPNIYAK